jgi:hypothetical protein
MEVRVEAVKGAINGHRHVLLPHLVEKTSNGCSGNVSRPSRNGLANVAHIGAIFVRGIFVTQLFQHLTTARVFTLLVAEMDSN